MKKRFTEEQIIGVLREAERDGVVICCAPTSAISLSVASRMRFKRAEMLWGLRSRTPCRVTIGINVTRHTRAVAQS